MAVPHRADRGAAQATPGHDDARRSCDSSVAYLYSAAVVFGLRGTVFFWETATLIDIMLLGHWIEMRSVMGASRALEELVRLLPSEAHRLRPDGSIEDVPLTALKSGDPVLVKPGEKIQPTARSPMAVPRSTRRCSRGVPAS